MAHSVNRSGAFSSLIDSLVATALAGESYDCVFQAFCDGLVETGLPLLRCHLAMQTLHPLVASVGLIWIRGETLQVSDYDHSSVTSDEWLNSPLYWMLSNKQRELRQRLNDPVALERFPVFAEFRESGGSDYLSLVTAFGDSSTVFEHRNGILTSWVSDAADGFTQEHIDSIKYLQPYVGLVAKLSKLQFTANNVVSAYLGQDIGRHVLEGQIRLGDVERIHAVIWLCDLRNSTAMAEQMEAKQFLKSLNAYFECTAGAVLEHGGQVLSFIGDAVLAIFPVSVAVTGQQAAQRALAASGDARLRIAALNQCRAKSSDSPMDFGLGLHIGDVLYGNIGVPARLEFSVIGRAVNEVSRLESLTKEVCEPVLVSSAFKDLVDQSWRDLGKYQVKGVSDGLRVFALQETS